MKTTVVLFHSLLLLFSTVIFAADNSDKASAAKTLTTSPVTTGALVETLFGLLLVLVCIAFLAWLLRRTGRFDTTANGEMKIIAGLSLGPRERAVLIQVGEQQILVGVTAQQIQTLHVLDQPISNTNPSNTPTRFAEKLQQIMQQRGNS